MQQEKASRWLETADEYCKKKRLGSEKSGTNGSAGTNTRAQLLCKLKTDRLWYQEFCHSSRALVRGAVLEREIDALLSTVRALRECVSPDAGAPTNANILAIEDGPRSSMTIVECCPPSEISEPFRIPSQEFPMPESLPSSETLTGGNLTAALRVGFALPPAGAASPAESLFRGGAAGAADEPPSEPASSSRSSSSSPAASTQLQRSVNGAAAAGGPAEPAAGGSWSDGMVARAEAMGRASERSQPDAGSSLINLHSADADALSMRQSHLKRPLVGPPLQATLRNPSLA